MSDLAARGRREPSCLPKAEIEKWGKAVRKANLAGMLYVEGLKRGDKLQRPKGP